VTGTATVAQIVKLFAAAALVAALVLSVLISALETVVLPRQGFTRIARSRFAAVTLVRAAHR
jgi:hypothetical protein